MMNFMDDLSALLGDCAPDGPGDYQDVLQLENRLLGKLRAVAGNDLTDKFVDASAERMDYDRWICFLRGLRLGAELLAI